MRSRFNLFGNANTAKGATSLVHAAHKESKRRDAAHRFMDGAAKIGHRLGGSFKPVPQPDTVKAQSNLPHLKH